MNKKTKTMTKKTMMMSVALVASCAGLRVAAANPLVYPADEILAYN